MVCPSAPAMMLCTLEQTGCVRHREARKKNKKTERTGEEEELPFPGLGACRLKLIVQDMALKVSQPWGERPELETAKPTWSDKLEKEFCVIQFRNEFDTRIRFETSH